MGRGVSLQNSPADVTQLIDQLERHCLAPDGSLMSKSAYYHLQLAREKMSKERQPYLESLAVYIEATTMVEDYQQALSVANLSGIRDVQGFYFKLGLRNPPQVYEALEHRMVVAEAAQRLRLPLISKDGEIHEEEIEKWSIQSISSFDSTSTSITLSSTSNSTYQTNASAIGALHAASTVSTSSITDTTEPDFGGVPNRFLGVTPAYLWQTQLHQMPSVDVAEYQRLLSREIGGRLDAKCDKLADAVAIGDIDISAGSQISAARLPERVKLIIEEIEREETAWLEDLYSYNRKFAEYYYVLEQILAVLIKLVKDIKLDHQHKYDELQKTWLCKKCETMRAKLRVLEHKLFLLETYTPETVPALHKIRKYLIEATEEAMLAYDKAAAHLCEYQGVDPHFDEIARQYHEIVKKLESMRWTINQVEMDLNPLSAHPST